MAKVYDAAVIGLGAMGGAALFNLAKRGLDVVGLEQFEPGHDRGSSHGESRIIRLSYYEDPSYVPLLRRAYEEWRAFETLDGGEAGSLLTITGILEAGHPASVSVANSLKAARLHDLPFTEMSGSEIGRRFPAFDLPRDWHGLFQPDGGFLRPELAVRRFVSAAATRGAEVRTNTIVRAIEPKPGSILVRTDEGAVEAATVIVAAGAWIGDFAPELNRHLAITRQVIGWFPPRKPENFAPRRCPVFILDAKEDHCYGFPNFAGTGVKAASHVRGTTLQHPNDLDPVIAQEDEDRIARMFARYMPDVGGPATRMMTCMYTRTADGHFLLDRSPRDPRVILASPCSGHGFKFVSLLGKVLADLVEEREPEEDIGLFRFGARMPADQPALQV